MKGIIDILLERTKDCPDRKIFNFLDFSTEERTVTEVTIDMVFRNAKAIAWKLLDRGAKKGDRVVILSLQDPGTLYAVYGAIMAGTIFTIIPPPIDEGKVERFISVVKSCQPKFIISNYALEHERLSKAQPPQLTQPPQLQQPPQSPQSNGRSPQSGLKKQLLRQAFFEAIRLKRIYTDRINTTTRGFPLHTAAPEDVIYLQYTSGSTSDPKGVMVTLKNLMTNINQVQELYDYSTGNSLAMWVPFFHNLGLLFGIFLPITALEGRTYFLQTLQFLQKPTLWLRVLSDYQVKLTAGPNSAYALFPNILTLKAASAFDLTHVTHFMNGSEFVDPVTIRSFADLFGIRAEAFACGYGMAENVCLVTAAHKNHQTLWVSEDALRRNRFVPCEPGQGKELVSLGEPVRGITMIAVDPATGKPCEEDQVGEMYIQGDTVCKGYWGGVRDNENFRARIEGHQGYFFKTGDIGILYGGNFYMTDRIKEIIIINGHNVYPGDIKAALKKNIPALSADASVFFTVEANNREAIVACLETDRINLDFAALAAQVNQVAARIFEFSFYDVVFLKKNTLPRTDNLKIRTHKVRELYLQEKLSQGVHKPLNERNGELPPEGMPQVLFSSRKNASAREKTTSPETALNGIHEKVKSVFDNLLERQDYDLDTGFLELGGDSLKMVECACQLEEVFHINLDVTQVGLNASVNGIAELIQHNLLEGNGKAKKVNLQDECTLDPSIAPGAPYDHSMSACRNLFLTGSTGFLGAFLIRSLIEQNTGKDIRIYCHVRAQNEEKGRERVISNMKHYRCWKDEYAQNIQAVTGSLEQPRLGMREDVYQELSQHVDAVYHNGAMLNFLFPYQFLKASNVDGTRECLRFACTGRAKYFHYISSYSVYDNPSHFGKKVYESDPLASGEGYLLGYSETKWVSEKLAQSARERGLKACIYRPGDITGDTVNGIWEMKDLISRLIVGCIHMQKAPDIKTRLFTVPVDYVSEAIAHISRQEGACNLAFNILNPESFTIKSMVKAIRRMGYRIRIVPYESWREELRGTNIRENPLRVLASLFPEVSGTAGSDYATVTSDNAGAADVAGDLGAAGATGPAGENLLNRFGRLQPRYDMTNTNNFLEDTEMQKRYLGKHLLTVYLKYFMEQKYI